ncbi:SulP family inorganic anion transporter [Alloacidobacterium sp.]|uniref:SulP family inorganic anion transporter n=1 Tax=Alloacidobacterium sp. TaxID=2951999 RepID=UPI002D411A2A|nr:SulP family inorganic anion transporter [Alloacidobacterium sp.]HYK35886.1 SulP family inorganic anion transporter [Alloacidobacterium sp.]
MSQWSISRLFPISGWLPNCSAASTRLDILAGIALAGLLVPEGMAYAGIAGVPPQMGLYAAAAGMFVYAVFGTSRQLAVTSTSSSAAMLAALVSPLAVGDPAQYVLLASATTVAVGLIFLAGGLLKLGSVSEFISRPVLKGFVFGLALTIMVKQAHKLTGISGGQGNFFHQTYHALASIQQMNPWTCAVGAAAIAVMFLLEVFAPRIPSALVVLVLGVLSASWLGLKQHHVEVVGTIQAGMPSLRLPRIGEDNLAAIFVGSIGIVLVLTAEALAAARTFASKHKYEINPNQELCAMGAANIASGLVGGIVVGGGMSGTAANDSGGARTQFSTITSSVFVGVTLAFLLPLISNLPEAVLGAIVVHAVAHLADIGTLKYYARLRTGSIWISLIALVGVLQMGILKGLIFAVGITLVIVMWKLSIPQDSVLGRLPGSPGNFIDVERHPEAEQIPHLLIVRPNGMLFFANANRIHNRLRELTKPAGVPLHAVLINLETTPEIDVTSLEMLEQLRTELRESNIVLYLARVTDRVHDLLDRSGFTDRLGKDRIFPGVDSAVNAFLENSISETVSLAQTNHA